MGACQEVDDVFQVARDTVQTKEDTGTVMALGIGTREQEG